MANRFRDTTIWNEDWYCNLGGEYMLLWDYICDNCDNAGVWKPNKIGFERSTGLKVNLDSFLKKVNGDKKRIIALDNGRWFLPGFIKYQWFTKKDSFDLVLSIPHHLNLYNLLKSNNINVLSLRGCQGVREGLPTHLVRDINTESINKKDLEVVKEKKVKPKVDKTWEVSWPWESESFKSKWLEWKIYQKVDKKRPYRSQISEQSALNLLVEYADNDEKKAIETLNYIMANKYPNLFKLTPKNNGNTENFKQYTNPISSVGRTIEFDRP